MKGTKRLSQRKRTSREGRRGPAAGDEARHEEDVTAAPLEESLGPLDPAPGLLAGEETLLDRLADEAAEPVRRVVAGERAGGPHHDHERKRQLAARGLDPADDQRALARQRREHGVAEADREQDQICPVRPREEVDEVLKEGEEQAGPAYRGGV